MRKIQGILSNGSLSYCFFCICLLKFGMITTKEVKGIWESKSNFQRISICTWLK
ncbi:SPASM domain-containing protein [Alkalibacterium sp. 20]|uniref:SPASM domain-containing protein n=1 Tax=Alkalibacterium sp. 20 TaxID=1798803 RepID=UPI003527B8BE